MLSELDKNKVKDFVDHLLEIPNINKEPILIGEGLILNFIVQNMDQLKKTFKTPQYFPDHEWNDILQILVSDLYNRTVNTVMPVFTDFIEGADFEAFNKVSDGASLPNDFQREKLLGFIQTIFKNKDARYNLNSTLNIFRNDIVEKYLIEIFNRHEVIYNEIVRVQKTYLECDEYITYMKALLLVKNAAYIKIPFGSNKISLVDSMKMPGKLPKFIIEASRYLRQQVPNLSEKSIALALKSNLKSGLTNVEDASSRLIFILSARFHNYKPVSKVDRGAESPDKSWFAIARKNSEHYGFDKRMLDALYRIAGDNNW